MLHEPLDRAALPGGVAALEQDHVLGARVLRPVLELQQLDLQLVLLFFVDVAIEPLVVGVVLAPGLDRIAPRVDQVRVGEVFVVPHAVAVAQQMVEVLAEVLTNHHRSIGHCNRSSRPRGFRTGGRQADLQVAQQVGQALLVGVAEGLQDVAFVGQVGLGDAVDERAALRGEADGDGAAVVRIGGALDQSGPFEAVEALGRTARGEHERGGEVGGAEAERGPGAPQCGEDVVPAGFEAVLAVDGLQALFDLAGQPGDAADDADRGGVEVGSLAAPLVEDVVDAVASWGRHAEAYQDVSSWKIAS